MSHYYDKNKKCNKCGKWICDLDVDYEINKIAREEGINIDGYICNDCANDIAINLGYHKTWDGSYSKNIEPKKKCKCGNEPLYKNGDIQLCSKCLGAIWTGRISLEEYRNTNSSNIEYLITKLKIEK